jgi:hypothetical protein
MAAKKRPAMWAEMAAARAAATAEAEELAAAAQRAAARAVADAQEFLAELDRSVDMFRATGDRDGFVARNRSIWDRIRAAGSSMDAEVAAAIAERSGCA